MTDKTTAEATSIWDKRYEEGTHVGSQPNVEGDPIDYTQHKFLYGHAVAKPMTGSLDGWCIDQAGRRWMTPAPEKVLSLGCGMAFVEEHLLKSGYARHVLAYEMSSAAIEAAKARIAGTELEGKLELRSADVLEEDLPTGAFDVVFVQAAIHHFVRIEEMYALIHRVLRPGGLLIYDEYVGPDHHLYGQDVLSVMDEIDACLAERYRWDVLAKHTRHGVPKPSLEFMLQHDPTEGVHAADILPLTYRYFDVVDRIDYGGAIMRPFFTGILPNFDWNDPKDQTVARLVVLIEQLLTRHSIIPTYHSQVVGRRRDVPLPPLSDAEKARIAYADWPGLNAQTAGQAPEQAVERPAGQGTQEVGSRLAGLLSRLTGRGPNR